MSQNRVLSLFVTWFPSADSGLHGELDDGDSVDGELIVEKRSVGAKFVTRQINRPLPKRRGVAAQRWSLDVPRRRICKAWIAQHSDSFSNTRHFGNTTVVALTYI